MDKKKTKDFLRSIVQKDLDDGKYKSVVTRFPPEPNGFPHIGHAKSIHINFGIARDFGGVCNLRMDDTNPTTEDSKYADALKDAVRWLGFEWDGEVRHSSDYFDKLYEYAITLIKMGKAYVDSVNEEQMKELRGTVKSAGKRSEFASRSIKENLSLFEKMKNGEFADGTHVLRAKIDMSNPNMKMRDPLLYRIRNAKHFRTGDKWHIYPMYDFAHCLSDYIEGITHSICTLEFENNREIYDWILDALELPKPRPYQYEFARLNINYTVMSKRKLLELVNEKKVSGWDDPRLPTIAGLRRRGYTSESIRAFCEQIGIAKANSVVDLAQLEHCIRDDLNQKAPRVMAVLDPLKVSIVNYEGEEELDASLYPSDVAKKGSRKLPFSSEIYIEREDFCEKPPKGYFRLTPDQAVRLKHGYIISCEDVIKDENGKVLEIKAKYYPNSKSGSDKSGIKVRSAIQWVDAKSAKKAEVRIYDRLYKCEDPQGMEDLNENSLKVMKNALIEPAVLELDEDRFQFERQGYFYKDPVDFTKEQPVFNKTVGLKDSWNRPKKQHQVKPKKQKEFVQGEVAPMNEKEQKKYELYQNLGLNAEVANTIARDEVLSNFFEEALGFYDKANTLANLVANEVAKSYKNETHKNIKAEHIATLARMIDDELISSKIAKQVYEQMEQDGGYPKQIVEDKNLMQISDVEVIKGFVGEVMRSNPDKVEQVKNGNEKLLGFFVGQVLKLSEGKANPKVVGELIGREFER